MMKHRPVAPVADLRAALPAVVAAACLALTGCGDAGADKTAVTTRLDAVEVQPGTISDAMVMLDDSGIDGTAIDTSVPAAPPPSAEKAPSVAVTEPADDPDGPGPGADEEPAE